MNPFYKDYQEYLAGLFPGRRMQKISVNAGMDCPNRDGTIGRGGCIYCSNTAFTPAYCMEGHSVRQQLSDGINFFSRKYPEMRYLAYFQSFTNTYGRSPEELRALYREAMLTEGIDGLVVGTRPDTLPDSTVELMRECAAGMPVIVELGVETTSDTTLELINRHHTWDTAADAIRRLKRAGLHVGVHLIAGLPGEDPDRALQSVDEVMALAPDSLKLHQLQIIRGTTLHREWSAGNITVEPFTLERYLDFCVEVIRRVGRRAAIERFLASAPPGMVVAPSWGLKNHQFTDRLLSRLKKTNH